MLVRLFRSFACLPSQRPDNIGVGAIFQCAPDVHSHEQLESFQEVLLRFGCRQWLKSRQLRIQTV